MSKEEIKILFDKISAQYQKDEAESHELMILCGMILTMAICCQSLDASVVLKKFAVQVDAAVKKTRIEMEQEEKC